MTLGEAKAIIGKLAAAYPNTRVPAGTVSLWIMELRPLELALAQEAVTSLLHECRFFPSLAELYEHLGYVRERRLARQREEERRAAVEAEANLPRLPDEILRSMEELVDRLTLADRNGEPLELEEVADGVCERCGAEGHRIGYEGHEFCRDCARAAVAVAASLYRSEVALAQRWVEEHSRGLDPAAVEAEIARMLPDDHYEDERIRLADLAADLRREPDVEAETASEKCAQEASA